MYKRFEELTVWQQSRKYRQNIYELSQKFPKKEIYALINQLCRAASSITANIAEGYGRYHWQENIQACRIARGSINEVLDHLYTALDCKYISQEEFDEHYIKGRKLEQLLNGLYGIWKNAKLHNHVSSYHRITISARLLWLGNG